MSLKEDIEKVETKIKEVEQNSFALELLKDYKKANKRQFVIILVILGMWLLTIGAFLHYINTTGYEENERIQTIDDIDKIENSEIINGDINGEDYTN